MEYNSYMIIKVSIKLILLFIHKYKAIYTLITTNNAENYLLNYIDDLGIF